MVHRRALGESDDHPDRNNIHDFGGRVRYVKTQYLER